MIENLKRHIATIDADYADIRYEKMVNTEIVFNGKELGSIGENSTDGYVIRALKDGGFATMAVTRPEDLEKACLMVVQNAELLGKKSKEKVKLKTPPVVCEDVELVLNEDPRSISLDDKMALLKHYNDLALEQKNVQTTLMSYNEIYRDKFFVNSLGSEIHEQLLTTKIFGRIICKKGDVVQEGRVGIGGSDGFAVLRNREAEFIDKAKIVSDLLDAEPVKGGSYNLILAPDITGVFVHEAFGHFSEADLIENIPTLRDKMQVGAELGADILDIVDDPTSHGQLGHYKYDDEGVEVRPTVLMEGGVLKGRLHSMRSAAAFDEPLTGHCVAEDSRYEPLIRMGTIFIRPKDKSLDDLLKMAGDGIYVLGHRGGQTSGENFTFGAQYAFMVENGKIGRLVRDINIMGNLFTTMKNVVGISSEFRLGEIGGCGKWQMNMRSCYGGPHLLIKDVLVGGV